MPDKEKAQRGLSLHHQEIMQNTDDLLSLCRKYFPGLDWEILTGWATGSAGRFSAELKCRHGDITAFCEVRWGPTSKRWVSQMTIMTSDRYPDEPLTNEQALAQAAARWQQFSSEAMEVVEPHH